jgi:hypothetical protein
MTKFDLAKSQLPYFREHTVSAGMTLRIPTGRESGIKRGHGRSNIGYAGEEYKEFEESRSSRVQGVQGVQGAGRWNVRICPIKLLNPFESRGLLPFRISILELLELLELLVSLATLSSPR